MKTLVEYLLESSEAQRELKTYDEAAEYFKEKYGDEDRWPIDAKALKRAYDKVKSDENPDGKPAVILLKNGRWNVRRWVQFDIDTLESLKIDPKKANDNILDRGGHTNKFNFYGGFHNGSGVKDFPSSSEMEIIIATSLTMKGLKKDPSEEELKKAISFALCGKDDATDQKTKKLLAQYMDYFKARYKSSTGDISFDDIKGLTKGYDVEPGVRYRKLQNREATVRDEYNKNKVGADANRTPKTDIVGVSEDGETVDPISLKKESGAQAMSGSRNETSMTLKAYEDLLSEEDRAKLDEILKKDWEGANTDRNKDMTKVLTDILKKPENKKFMLAILKESLTGEAKFGYESDACPERVLSWGDGSAHVDDIDDYVAQLYNYVMDGNIESVFKINQKTSGKTNAALRIGLPSINKLRKYPNKIEDKELQDMLGARDEEGNKLREMDVVDPADPTKKKHVTIHIGPRGGRFWLSDKKDRDGNPVKNYVDRKGNPKKN